MKSTLSFLETSAVMQLVLSKLVIIVTVQSSNSFIQAMFFVVVFYNLFLFCFTQIGLLVPCFEVSECLVFSSSILSYDSNEVFIFPQLIKGLNRKH